MTRRGGDAVQVAYPQANEHAFASDPQDYSHVGTHKQAAFQASHFAQHHEHQAQRQQPRANPHRRRQSQDQTGTVEGEPLLAIPISGSNHPSLGPPQDSCDPTDPFDLFNNPEARLAQSQNWQMAPHAPGGDLYGDAASSTPSPGFQGYTPVSAHRVKQHPSQGTPSQKPGHSAVWHRSPSNEGAEEFSPCSGHSTPLIQHCSSISSLSSGPGSAACSTPSSSTASSPLPAGMNSAYSPMPHGMSPCSNGKGIPVYGGGSPMPHSGSPFPHSRSTGSAVGAPSPSARDFQYAPSPQNHRHADSPTLQDGSPPGGPRRRLDSASMPSPSPGEHSGLRRTATAAAAAAAVAAAAAATGGHVPGAPSPSHGHVRQLSGGLDPQSKGAPVGGNHTPSSGPGHHHHHKSPSQSQQYSPSPAGNALSRGPEGWQPSGREQPTGYAHHHPMHMQQGFEKAAFGRSPSMQNQPPLQHPQHNNPAFGRSPSMHTEQLMQAGHQSGDRHTSPAEARNSQPLSDRQRVQANPGPGTRLLRQGSSDLQQKQDPRQRAYAKSSTLDGSTGGMGPGRTAKGKASLLRTGSADVGSILQQSNGGQGQGQGRVEALHRRAPSDRPNLDERGIRVGADTQGSSNNSGPATGVRKPSPSMRQASPSGPDGLSSAQGKVSEGGKAKGGVLKKARDKAPTEKGEGAKASGGILKEPSEKVQPGSRAAKTSNSGKVEREASDADNKAKSGSTLKAKQEGQHQAAGPSTAEKPEKKPASSTKPEAQKAKKAAEVAASGTMRTSVKSIGSAKKSASSKQPTKGAQEKSAVELGKSVTMERKPKESSKDATELGKSVTLDRRARERKVSFNDCPVTMEG